MRIDVKTTTTETTVVTVSEDELKEMLLQRLRHDGTIPFESTTEVIFAGEDSHGYGDGGAIVKTSWSETK